MTTIIFFIFTMAFAHFVYEGIVAPSLRLKLRCELFALRDQVRWLKIQHGRELKDKHFEMIHDSINSTIHYLSRIDIWTAVQSDREFKENAEFRSRVEHRQKFLDDCAIAEVREVRRKSLHICAHALLVNSAATMFWASPGLLLVGILQWINRKPLALLKRVVRIWMSASEKDLERISPAVSRELPGLA